MASTHPPHRYPLAGPGVFRAGPCWACVSTNPTIPRMRFAPTSECSASIPPPRYRRPVPRTLSQGSSPEIHSPSAYPDPGAPFPITPFEVTPCGLYPAHPGPARSGFGYPLHAVSLTPESLGASFISQRPWGSPFRALLPDRGSHSSRSAFLSRAWHPNPPAWMLRLRGFLPRPEPYA
jgi:hypothetical protein